MLVLKEEKAVDPYAERKRWVEECERLYILHRKARETGVHPSLLLALARKGRAAAKACKAWDDLIRGGN